MDLFKELGESLRPEEFATITAFLSRGRKMQHTFTRGTTIGTIQLFLTKTYGSDCWAWE